MKESTKLLMMQKQYYRSQCSKGIKSKWQTFYHCWQKFQKFKDKKLDEQPNTRDMPELESAESAEQKGV